MPYTINPPITRIDKLSDGRVRIEASFAGTAGPPTEPTVPRERFLDESTTLVDLRRWAIAEATTLTGRRTIADTLTVGQAIDLAPIPVPAKTPLQLLEDDLVLKLRRHREAQKAIVEGALPAADNQVTNRKADFVAAFEAVRNAAGSNLNHALEFLL